MICPQERLFKRRGKKVKRQNGQAKRLKGKKAKRYLFTSLPLNLLTFLPLYLFTFSPFLTGCVAVRPTPPAVSELTSLSWMLQSPPGVIQNLSLDQIRDTLGSENTKFKTLKAKAQITFAAPATRGSLFCEGYVRLERPHKLRVIGTKLTATLFDMLSDGETFWLYLPSEKKIYTGKCNSMHRLARPYANILPDDIAMLLNYNDVLAPDAILTKAVDRIPIIETWPGVWLIHLVDLSNETAALRANLYIDRVSVNVIRYDIFGTNGNIMVQALFDDYARFDNSAIPQRIVIFLPGEKTTLTLSLSSIVTNEQIDPKVFQFSKPKSAEIVSLDNM